MVSITAQRHKRLKCPAAVDFQLAWEPEVMQVPKLKANEKHLQNKIKYSPETNSQCQKHSNLNFLPVN